MTTTDRTAGFELHVVPNLEFVARVARSMSNSAADADDLAQDALMRAWRAIDRFDGRYARSWLYTIIRNSAINRSRRKNRETPVPEQDLYAAIDPYDPETQVLDSFVDPRLVRALDGLPQHMRAVVDLVDINRLTYAEAATYLGVPRGTVMSRLHRARKRMAAELRGTDLEARVATWRSAPQLAIA